MQIQKLWINDLIVSFHTIKTFSSLVTMLFKQIQAMRLNYFLRDKLLIESVFYKKKNKKSYRDKN